METIIIDKETGEILEEGVFRSYKQIKKSAEYFEIKNIKEEKQSLTMKEYGNFIWILYRVQENYNDLINPSNLSKLMFVSTYLGYSGYLVFSNGKLIDKAKLRELLMISVVEYNKFYKEMLLKEIIIEKDNKIYINEHLFFKGKIDKLPFTINKNITRLYINSIREIYNKTNIKSHKQLSYIFKILPYVNIKYNIICFNPLEDNLEKLQPMNFLDFCDTINYNKSNYRNLKKIFKECYSIQNEYIISFVSNNNNILDTTLFINPRLYYAGNNWDKVEILGFFCKNKTV